MDRTTSETSLTRPDRRTVLAGGAAALAVAASPAAAQAQGPAIDWSRASHGLSTFGDLAQPADFRHFGYVNPQAPKGGTLSMQISSVSGNQSFNTFNTLNIFILKGEGAAGVSACFDSLMSGTADEPDAMYGLVAEKVMRTEASRNGASSCAPRRASMTERP